MKKICVILETDFYQHSICVIQIDLHLDEELHLVIIKIIAPLLVAPLITLKEYNLQTDIDLLVLHKNIRIRLVYLT